MQDIEFSALDKLMKEKYKATLTDKFRFRDILYGEGRQDLSSVFDMTEGIIQSENAVFYLINDVSVINENCKCIAPDIYSTGKVTPVALSGFLPFILFVAELNTDGNKVVSYARWGSFADNIFEEIEKRFMCIK